MEREELWVDNMQVDSWFWMGSGSAKRDMTYGNDNRYTLMY